MRKEVCVKDQILATMRWGRERKRTVEVSISEASLDRLSRAALNPEATLQFGSMPPLPCALPDSLRRQVAEMALENGDVGKIPEVEIGEDGILTMPKKNAWWTQNFNGIAMTIWLGKSKHSSGRIDDRYRICFQGKTVQCVFNDPEKAKKAAEDFAKLKSKELSLLRSKEGERVFAVFEAAMNDAAAVGITDFRRHLAESLTATQQLFEHVGYDPYDKATKIARPSLVAVVNDKIQRELRRRPSNPGLISLFGPLFIDVHRLMHENEGKCEATFKRHSANIGKFVEKFGDREAHTIDSFELEYWLTNSRGKTKGQARWSLIAFFTWMRDEHKALALGDSEADTLMKRNSPPAKKGSKKIEFYTADEVERLLNAALVTPGADEWLPVLAMRVFGGIHLSELMCLTWNEILDGAVIRITEDAAGNHSPRLVFLSPGAQTWIQSSLRRVEQDGLGETRIVPGMTSEKAPQAQVGNRTDAYNRMLDTLLAATGIKRIKNGLRHSFGTYYFHLAYCLEETQLQMGSHDINLFLFYIGLKVNTGDAVRYFCIHHPDFPSPENDDQWLPPSVTRKTRMQAMHDINAAIAAKEKKSKGRPRI